MQSLAGYRWNDGGFRRKGFIVINILITLNVNQRWFLNGIEDGFRGVVDKVLV